MRVGCPPNRQSPEDEIGSPEDETGSSLRLEVELVDRLRVFKREISCAGLDVDCFALCSGAGI